MGRINAEQELSLLDRILRGDTSAWPTFKRSFEPLIATCVRRALDRYRVRTTHADVEDMVSEVWLALLKDDMRKLRAFDRDRGVQLSSWIGLISTNHVIDRLRRSRPTSYIEDLGTSMPEMSTSDSPQTALERRSELSMAREALAQLKGADRDFLIACVWDEQNPADLAKTLGVSVNTVYSRKFKVRNKLTRIISRMNRERAVA